MYHCPKNHAFFLVLAPFPGTFGIAKSPQNYARKSHGTTFATFVVGAHGWKFFPKVTVRFAKMTGRKFISFGSFFDFGNFLVLVLGNSVKSADW